MSGISTFLRRDRRKTSLSWPCEHTSEKAAVYKPGSQPSPDTRSSWWSWTSSLQNWEKQMAVV